MRSPCALALLAALHFAAAFHAPPPRPAAVASTAVSRRTSLAAIRDDAGDSRSSFDDEDFELISRRRQSEERYPTEVFETTPPRALLGIFSLSQLVAAGDVLKHGDRAYVIKRVASKYKFHEGRFQLHGKRADATEAAREAVEAQLTQLLPD
ncbi:hypothetical protein M885DRAFT_519178 [Pelagophyceae sp. CCMP2097]|nr:hypothetical protein M885DRAFT_519178 [Pelagophyceae sp. CCMP2097]|mmetsp:Transcript_10331/g.34200  ORF Transcript_10331/g.34200 Transcript_10331/m.34200 type:complete len:152 (-) Transcript_10331:47-502(-)